MLSESSTVKVVERVAREAGLESVSLSSGMLAMAKAVPRGFTATADAYLTPKIKQYLASFRGGFERGLEGVRVLFMQSDGGLCPVTAFSGSRGILSGPAGGVVGVAATAWRQGGPPVVGFDMGGTSTDVSRYDGSLAHVFETTTAGVTIQAPQLEILTVAAGGGSRLFFRNGLFAVGPESAGADPGPVCYRKGGHLAVTDANLVLGRILPEHFPRIFGPGEDQPLDVPASRAALQTLTEEINAYLGTNKSVEEVASGFLEVANETMSRPIRSLTQAKGFDTAQHELACFGGAGAQHAAAVAQALGMRRVKIHRYAGILSAYGLALADVVAEAQEPATLVFGAESVGTIDGRLRALSERCTEELTAQGFADEHIRLEPFLHLRYKGTDCALMTPPQPPSPSSPSPLCSAGDFLFSFLLAYEREFGFTLPGRDVLVDDVRVRGVGLSGVKETRTLERAQEEGNPPLLRRTNKAFFRTCAEAREVFDAGRLESCVYDMASLRAGHVLKGPAVIVDANSTIVVEPECFARITDEGDVEMEIGVPAFLHKVDSTKSGSVDAIQLSIFSHRFMSIAEQMGRVLQRSAISTNIKERLDFSCALFGPDGGLIANAPHIPVHLGAMQETVRFQMKYLSDKGGMRDGDVILCNHPMAGGSHLPDLTVITPVFYQDSAEPVFYVANRGHHADIGGLVPGSMPPHAKCLAEEGATFLSFKLVEGGEFQEAALVEALMAPGKVAGCSGTRNLSDNLSDLRAQIAANRKGIRLVQALIDVYGLPTVHDYMAHIQDNAESAVRAKLRSVGSVSPRLWASDTMDDGSAIVLSVAIDAAKGEAVFDFTGTAPEVYGSCNAPKAVLYSGLIYCLRSLVGEDIPLNQGCLTPVRVVIPEGTILSPSAEAAVVGGNVLTSQRVCDVIFRAFRAAAASQGCMNNVTFGDQSFGYYETVAGGAGAGRGFAGRSGVHTHMTNTRITDPEILERRYPVVLKRFSLRPGSGGEGKWPGGDGVVREYLFRKSLSLSLLTERRVFAPWGLEGGGEGRRGSNLLKRDGRTINLCGKNSVDVRPGDVFVLETPGGGGFGRKE